MKRWISLLLALTMVLSMLTGLAGAEGVKEGIYLDSDLTQYVEGRRWYDGGPYGYTLYYTPGTELEFYYFCSNSPKGISAGDQLTVKAKQVPDGGGVLYVLALSETASGTFESSIYFSYEDEQENNGFPMMFVPEPVQEGVYTDASMSERVEQTEENGKPVYTVYYTVGDIATAAFYTEIDFSMDLSSISAPEGTCQWDKSDYYDGHILRIDLGSTAFGNVEVTAALRDSNSNSREFMVRFKPAELKTTSDMTDIWLPGTMCFDFLLNGEKVAADRVAEIQTDLKGAEILRVQDLIDQGDTHLNLEHGQFMIDMNRAYPEQTGTMSLKIDEKSYSLPVASASANYGFYTSADFDPDSYLISREKQSVFFEDGQPQQIWFKFTRGDKIKSVTSSSNLMTGSFDDAYVACFTVDPNFQGSFDTYLEVESENGGFFGINLSVANVRIATIEGGPVDRESQVTDLQMGPGRSEPFRIKGYDHDFYMSISRPDSRQPGNLGGMQPPMDPGQMEQFKTCISFWKDAGEGVYAKASDEETAAILEAFGTTLSQNLYTIDGERYPDMPEAKFYPTIHVMQDNLCTITVEMTLETAGAWVYYASGILYQGTDDEKTVDVPAHFDWMPRAAKKFFQPEGETPAEILEEINDFLKDYVEEKGVLWIVQIPEGEYEGLIEISNEGWGLQIDGIGTVILHGGVVNNSGGRPNITNIHFVGQGASNKKWTTGALVGSPNMAIYGNGGGRVDFCTFSGYDYAIYTDMITGVYGCAFAENNVAIMEDHEDGGGNPDLANNVFERNKIALNFEHIADRLSTVFFNISHNKFIDNKWDVRNKLKRSLYLPGNFFGRTDEDGNLEAVPCNHQIGSGEVVTMLDDTEINLEDTSFNTQIFAYPRATDPSCRTWVKEETAVLYNGHAAEFQIAEENVHGTTFIVMDEESELVQMVFPEAAPISMLAEGGQFDASVGFQTSDENDLVLMINDTLGLNPLVRLPLTGSDVQVLDPDGNKIETNYQDGYVEFTAGKGGDYTMAASLRVNRLNAHMMAVNLGSRGTGKQVVVAVYEPSGKLADLQIPENVTGFWMYENQNLDLTACEIKVMLVDGDYVPGCEAVTLEAAAE